jgi:hypothetical protein
MKAGAEKCMTKDDLEKLNFGDVVESAVDRERYVITQAMFPGGHAVAVTTAMIGPENCKDWKKVI